MKKPKKVAPKKVVAKPNMLFPGLPDYKGPDKGWFAWVHHGKLFEHTRADGNSIKARVEYVRKRKPKDERAIRLSHIMYLGKALGAKLTTHMKKPSVGGICYNYDNLDSNEMASCWVLAYIEKHKARNQWVEDANSLCKANGDLMTG